MCNMQYAICNALYYITSPSHQPNVNPPACDIVVWYQLTVILCAEVCGHFECKFNASCYKTFSGKA